MAMKLTDPVTWLESEVSVRTISHYICVWPDGVFCDATEVMGMSHRSDDYANVPVLMDQSEEEAADLYMQNH